MPKKAGKRKAPKKAGKRKQRGGSMDQMGGSWFSDAWDGVKSVANTVKKGYDWVKDNKAASRLGDFGASIGVPGAGVFAARARQLGLGKGRKGMRGGNVGVNI